MSADLHLVALPDDPATLALYRFVEAAEFTTSDDGDERDTDGYVNVAGYRGLTFEDYQRANEEMGRGEWPNIWIGQVSWMKAGLLDQPDRWIPAPVLAVHNLYVDEPILTRGLASATMAALNLPNRSHFGHTHFHWQEGRYHRDRTRGLARRQDVKRWLNAYLGRRIAAESW